jgi:TatD DNase family protein
MSFTDTHCHLDAAAFACSPSELLQTAQAVGVERIVIPAVNAASFDAIRQLCVQFPALSPAYGIHPMYTGNAAAEDIMTLRTYLELHHPVALGEIGLDFFIANPDRVQQEAFFVMQLKLAQEFDLPVLLHIRRAQDIVLKHLRQTKVRGGIAHAFSGSVQQAEEFIKLGFKLGFGGAFTWGRATRLRKLAASLPLSCLVLETDAPDMPPAFIETGTPNKPEYLPRIAQELAILRAVSVEEIAEATTVNALQALPGLKSSVYKH